MSLDTEWTNEVLADTEYVERLRQRLTEYSEPELNTGCWLWSKKLDHGYGAISVGRVDIGHKLVRAHRASVIAFRGVDVFNLHVRHKCDTPSCVNPDHLEVGSHKENMADAVSRGRTTRGRKRKPFRFMSEQEIQIALDPKYSLGEAVKITGFTRSSIRERRIRGSK